MENDLISYFSLYKVADESNWCRVISYGEFDAALQDLASTYSGAYQFPRTKRETNWKLLQRFVRFSPDVGTGRAVSCSLFAKLQERMEDCRLEGREFVTLELIQGHEAFSRELDLIRRAGER